MSAYISDNRSEEGLQAVQPGLEVLQPGLETYSRTVPSTISSDHENDKSDYLVETDDHSRRTRRFLGLRLSTFCIIIVLIGAIVAAIVAGVLASKTHCHASATTSNSSILSTTITAAASPTATPSSQCSSQAGQDWISPLSHLKYTRVCNTYLDSSKQQYQNLFTAYQSSLDTCVAMCDSYNYWTKSTNATVAVWNWKGKSNQTPGTCWCVQVEGEYSMESTEGQDSALRVGSFGEGTIPS